MLWLSVVDDVDELSVVVSTVVVESVVDVDELSVVVSAVEKLSVVVLWWNQ